MKVTLLEEGASGGMEEKEGKLRRDVNSDKNDVIDKG
jgi:hypothetical protein